MKNSVILLLILTFSLAAPAQKTKPAKKISTAPPTAAQTSSYEEREFQNARSQASIADRIAALKMFTADFPNSENKTLALELIVSSRAELGDQKLRLSDNQSGIDLFKLAVEEAPTPISDKLYAEIILQFPTNLFFRNQREAALEIAKLIEEKVSGNAKQMLGLAAFYLGTENAFEAKRLAERAIALEPDSADAYQTLGLANRLNFDLEESAAAYAKALEFRPDSIVSKRSLAEMKRANGRPDEAAALYREILSKDAADNAARTGLILSLFDAKETAQAEAEMAKSLEANPKDLSLLVGAAYWYAANSQGAKAIELAGKAIAVEPRYTWAHIALARGLIQEKRPLEAEHTLLLARQYGNFPTLDYEIAAARLAAGFYREAADELKKSFSIEGDSIGVKLGGRVPKEGKSFADILSFERRASIFEPLAADDSAADAKLKALLRFTEKMEAEKLSETEITEAADEFVRGDDNMKIHRGLYAADRLLYKRVAPTKALQLTDFAVGKVETGLDVTTPAAAVLADELYDTRTLAATRNELLIVPDLPRQTLSNILRGRIEELTGWAFLQEGKADEAAVRFRRAISILPEKSAWWRASKWRLGDALEAVGKSKEALSAYIAGYNAEEPDLGRRIVIESLYQKVNGTTAGLDDLIGAKPVLFNPETAQKIDVAAKTPTPEPSVAPTPEPRSTVAAIPANVPIVRETPEAKKTSQTEPIPKADVETLRIPENVLTEKTEVKTEDGKDENAKLNEIEAANGDSPSIPAVSTVLLKREVSPTSEVQMSVETEVKTSPTSEKIKTVESSTVPSEASENQNTTNISPETTIERISENRKIERTDNSAEKSTLDKTQDSSFEPVVINVLKSEKNARMGEEEKGKNQFNESTVNESTPQRITDLSASRPRIVSAIKKSEDEAENITPCVINISKDNISLLNGGGSVGIFVGFEGAGGDPKQVSAKSSSPQDLEAAFQSDIGVLTKRAFFILKSISTKTGIYTITFESNCGEKEITVAVR